MAMPNLSLLETEIAHLALQARRHARAAVALDALIYAELDPAQIINGLAIVNIDDHVRQFIVEAIDDIKTSAREIEARTREILDQCYASAPVRPCPSMVIDVDTLTGGRH
jgi:hypothetical protein